MKNKKYLTPEEINARLAETRDQPFRKRSQKQIDGLNIRLANGWLEKNQQAIQKTKKSGIYNKTAIEVVKKREQNGWFEKNQQAYQNRKTSSKCQVKEPGKDWKTFVTMREACRYYNASTWQVNTKKSFPEDGSTRTLRQGRFKGFQTRRIVD